MGFDCNNVSKFVEENGVDACQEMCIYLLEELFSRGEFVLQDWGEGSSEVYVPLQVHAEELSFGIEYRDGKILFIKASKEGEKRKIKKANISEKDGIMFRVAGIR